MKYYGNYTEYKRARRKRIMQQVKFNLAFFGAWAVVGILAFIGS